MAVITSTDQDFEAYVNDNKYVVVKYFAGWCGSCKLFAPKYKRVSNEEGNEDIAFLEVNAEENEKSRKLAGVDHLPFLATFKNGELTDTAASSKEEILKELLTKLKA